MDLSRKIYITGEINDEAFVKFNRRLSRLEQDPYSHIYIDLTSEGGEAYAALAFFDRIRSSPCMISITAYGYVASAAVLILSAGDTRVMSSSSWLMVHEDSTTVDTNMTVSQVEKDAAHSRRMEDQWCKLLASVTTTNESVWASLHKNETYLTAQECLELGIIDKVLE